MPKPNIDNPPSNIMENIIKPKFVTMIIGTTFGFITKIGEVVFVIFLIFRLG